MNSIVNGLLHKIRFPNVKIHPTARIGKYVTIEKGCSVGARSFIGNGCVLRNYTYIGKDTIIGHLTVFEGYDKIGDRVLIHAQCHITRKVIIEDFVFIAPMFLGANDPLMCHERRHVLKWEETPYVVKRGARIGSQVTVLPGIIIGENSFVGAASLVTKDVAPRDRVRGVPAKVYGRVPVEECL